MLELSDKNASIISSNIRKKHKEQVADGSVSKMYQSF